MVPSMKEIFQQGLNCVKDMVGSRQRMVLCMKATGRMIACRMEHERRHHQYIVETLIGNFATMVLVRYHILKTLYTEKENRV